MSQVVQSNFYIFHDRIKLESIDNRKVTEKREMLINEIKAFLNKKAENDNSSRITFSTFNQGSYSMGTGIKPDKKDDDYDIDVGIEFNISKEDHKPLEVKQWVFDALNSKKFRTVEWKKPCITVQYYEDDLPRFHIDFASYAAPELNSNRTYIAKGKPTISKDQNEWEESEPKRLKELINNKFSDSIERSQFKRSIRYIKRWKDIKFNSVNGKPTGIAITALAYNGFKPYVKDSFTNQDNVNDHKALIDFINYILGQFSFFSNRIQVSLPVPPYNDLFEKMTDEQCKVFKNKLKNLLEVLQKSYDDPDPHEACKLLKSEFGKDFPVPDKEETAQSRKKAIVGGAESA